VEKILTPAEVADVMRLNRRTVYKLLESGELRGRKVGRVWRIPESAISEYMEGDQGGGGKVQILYDGEVVGEIVTNRSMTLGEALELVGIDPTETDGHCDPKWDYELFEMRY
jgi:excisionase family DNA binding protein